MPPAQAAASFMAGVGVSAREQAEAAQVHGGAAPDCWRTRMLLSSEIASDWIRPVTGRRH
ncbi:MAG TPA: hypothetical protein DDY78_19935 [Planctomycetales bacterium]|nr:hypothetical protein [Planctomycetales bacterium]